MDNRTSVRKLFDLFSNLGSKAAEKARTVHHKVMSPKKPKGWLLTEEALTMLRKNRKQYGLERMNWDIFERRFKAQKVRLYGQTQIQEKEITAIIKRIRIPVLRETQSINRAARRMMKETKAPIKAAERITREVERRTPRQRRISAGEDKLYTLQQALLYISARYEVYGLRKETQMLFEREFKKIFNRYVNDNGLPNEDRLVMLTGGAYNVLGKKETDALLMNAAVEQKQHQAEFRRLYLQLYRVLRRRAKRCVSEVIRDDVDFARLADLYGEFDEALSRFIRLAGKGQDLSSNLKKTLQRQVLLWQKVQKGLKGILAKKKVIPLYVSSIRSATHGLKEFESFFGRPKILKLLGEPPRGGEEDYSGPLLGPNETLTGAKQELENQIYNLEKRIHLRIGKVLNELLSLGDPGQQTEEEILGAGFRDINVLDIVFERRKNDAEARRIITQRDFRVEQAWLSAAQKLIGTRLQHLEKNEVVESVNDFRRKLTKTEVFFGSRIKEREPAFDKQRASAK
jgi:hypothetical protein